MTEIWKGNLREGAYINNYASRARQQENSSPQRPLPHAARTNDLVLRMGIEKFFLFLSALLFSPFFGLTPWANLRQKGSTGSPRLPLFTQVAPANVSHRKSLLDWVPFTRKLENSACTVCVWHLLFLNTILYYFTSLSPGDGDEPPFHERKEKAFPNHCVVMSQETVTAAHCLASSNPTKFYFTRLKKLLWPVSWQLGNWHCVGNRRVHFSGPQGALPRWGRRSLMPKRFLFFSFTWVKLKWAVSRVNGQQAASRGPGSERRAGSRRW